MLVKLFDGKDIFFFLRITVNSKVLSSNIFYLTCGWTRKEWSLFLFFFLIYFLEYLLPAQVSWKVSFNSVNLLEISAWQNWEDILQFNYWIYQKNVFGKLQPFQAFLRLLCDTPLPKVYSKSLIAQRHDTMFLHRILIPPTISKFSYIHRKLRKASKIYLAKDWY